MTDIATDQVHFTFFEARRWVAEGVRPVESPREFLRWLRPGDYYPNAAPIVYTTMPRDGMSGLPRDWWHTTTTMFAASSMRVEGVFQLEVKGRVMLEMPLGMEELMSRRRWPLTLRENEPFRITFKGGVRPRESEMALADMQPIRSLTTRLLASFDEHHPGVADSPGSYLLQQHRRELASLLELPGGQWTLVGLAGPTKIVIV